MAKKKIFLFCDPGIDDSLAIIYTLLHPHLELVEVVTSYGNVTKDQATANAYYLLNLAGQKNVPIIPGLFNPYSRRRLSITPRSMEQKELAPSSSLLTCNIRSIHLIRSATL